jgi:hypothetical protein
MGWTPAAGHWRRNPSDGLFEGSKEVNHSMVFFVRRLAIRVTQARWNGEEALDVNHAKALGLLRFWELLTQ